MFTPRRLIFSLAIVIALLFMGVAAVPSWRQWAQSYFTLVGNEVLATAEGDLLNDGSVVKVIKYRSDVGIFVEILAIDEKGGTKLIDRILMPDKRDGLFNYQGHVTRLAIADIDNSGQQRLLVPTFDNQLIPHLNVFRYNPAIKRFEPFQPPK